MDNFWMAEKIKHQIEALVLESFLAVLDKLTDKVITIRDDPEKKIVESLEKF
jgi:hypothetical protein